jgi:hypothetical protein
LELLAAQDFELTITQAVASLKIGGDLLNQVMALSIGRTFQ